MAAPKKKQSSRNQSQKGKTAQAQRNTGIELVGLGIICAAVVSFIVLLSVDNPNNMVRSLLDGLAGRFSVVLPFIILWAGLLITFSGGRQRNVGRILMIASCILLGFSMAHIFFARSIISNLQLGGGWLNFIEQSFFTRAGAGAIGALLSYPVYIAAGPVGGFVILLFILAALIVILKQISLRQVGEHAHDYLQNSYANFRENQSKRSAQRAIDRAERQREYEAQRAAQVPPVRKGRTTGGSWDAPVYSDESVESIDPIGADSGAQSDPLPRRGLVLEVPEYLKNGGRQRKKPAFGETFTAPEEDKPTKVSSRKKKAPAEEIHETFVPEAEASEPAETEPDFIPYEEDAYAAEEETPYEEHAPEDSVESSEKDVYFADDESEEPVDLPSAGSDEDVFTEYDAPEENLFEAEEEEPQPEESPFILPPFDIDEPVQRERRRKTLNEPVKPASSAPKYAPDDYIPPNDDYVPGQRPIEPGVRLDHTPLVMPKKHDSPEEEVFPEYNYPPVDLLSLPKVEKEADRESKDQAKAAKLESTLHEFGINAKLVGIAHGPAVTRFELVPAPGVKVSRITSLTDDIALSLAALSVRIEAPIPGKAAVGVEIPNETVESVPLREVLESAEARKHPSRLAVGMGKDNSGKCIIGDIAKMPHVLIAGATGSGKSVCINCIICSILYRATPEEVRLIMIDPKVVELSIYNGIPHLLVPVVTDPKKASGALQWAVAEMSDRYKKFAERGVRDIKGYNQNCGPDEKPMPQIVIIIDELADLMMVTPGEVEDSICRLAQLARAAGIHLVIATQRPSVNVITGVIKANIPARIAFTVASFVDSRTILDVGGAEKLLGRGDMLFSPSGPNKMQRVQGAWVSDDEVHAIVEYIKARHDVEYNEDVIEHMNKAEDVAEPEPEESSDECDELLQQAIEIVVEAGQASISMLQRRLRIGYARAGRLIDEMAARGIVSQSEGAKARNVLITREQFNTMFRDDTNI